jgi:hypothetical protein
MVQRGLAGEFWQNCRRDAIVLTAHGDLTKSGRGLEGLP